MPDKTNKVSERTTGTEEEQGHHSPQALISPTQVGTSLLTNAVQPVAPIRTLIAVRPCEARRGVSDQRHRAQRASSAYEQGGAYSWCIHSPLYVFLQLHEDREQI